MSIIGSNILAGASGQGVGGGYTIENSLRFRSSASAYLNRTPASAGDLDNWTWSGWVKRGSLSTGTTQYLFSASSDVNNWGLFRFNTNNTLTYTQADAGSVNLTATTTAVFRDPSAWYHIVLIWESAASPTSDQVQLYVNGVRQTLSYTPLASGTDSRINRNILHTIGRVSYSAAAYFDGYLAEVNFIDGHALTPSDFGNYNATTGVWQPVAYSGSYGTNGFYLPFSDNTNTTTLVADSSGNGNDWTPTTLV